MRSNVMSRGLSVAVFLLSAFAFMSGLAQKAHAEGTFISAPGRVDMVYDDARQILYITSGDSVLRYSLGSNSFLTPFNLGGSLKGIDLSPDGNTLAVADQDHVDGELWIDVVDLKTGKSKKAVFSQAFGEGGAFTVAFAANNSLLISSKYEGSGWVPLRKYNLTTGSVTNLGDVCQDSMLSASADGSVIGFEESNSSDGPFGRYRTGDGNLLRKSGYDNGTSWFNYEIGVNRNGSQYAIPTYGGAFIADANLKKYAKIGEYAGGQPIGVVYSPVRDIVYFPWATTTKVYAYDTNTFEKIGSYDFENTFDHPGNHAFQEGRLKVSRNGRFLFATVQDGVRYVDLGFSGEPPARAPWTTFGMNPIAPNGTKGWYKTKPAITLSAEGTSTIYYQWDSTSGHWMTYTGPYNPPSQGSHILYYYSVNRSGAEEAVKSAAVKWDGQAPTNPTKLRIVDRFANLFYITWQESNDNIGVADYEREWSIDQKTWKKVANLEGLDLNTLYSSYYFRARAVDEAGNYSKYSKVASTGGWLDPETLVISKDERFGLVYQDDGNLVLYRGRDGAALWSSKTDGAEPGRAVMQGDGNFVIYDAKGKAKWASKTNGHRGSRLVVQNDGNVVLYGSDNKPLWATWTQGKY